jgi:acetyl-CoA synthetase
MHDPTARVRQLLQEANAPRASAIALLLDRHPTDAVAFTVVEDDLSAVNITYGELRKGAAQVHASLAALGLEPGDRVATLMGKGPELLAVMLGIWRLGAVYVPLFTAFGPQAIAMRLTDTNTRLVIVDQEQRGKLDPGPDMPADSPWQVVTAGTDAAKAGSLAVEDIAVIDDLEPFVGGGAWPLVHMLTSGTTGRPKGVVHHLPYLAGWEIYLEFGLDVRASDAFWCAADPGWAYGLYTAVIAPLALGLRSHLVKGRFSAELTARVLRAFAITNFAAAPTVYRSLRATGLGGPGLSLRCASSAGEPLTPEVNEWAVDALGAAVHDHFGQTETGMTIGNHHHPALARPLKPGSMGSALPGWSAAVLRSEDDSPAPAGELGRIAIDIAGSPLMTFTGYEGEAGSKFTSDGHWYLTGDGGRQDRQGDVFFSARDDDVIIMAGYRIGPFDIESVLAQHPAVAECAVIAAPDVTRGEILEAVVVLRPPHVASEQLVLELQELVKTRYAAYAYPRSVRFAEALPKTPSGKIQRYRLRDLQSLAPAPSVGGGS